MHSGFSLLEAGCVRFKNTQNILAKNVIVVTVGFLSWYIMGWPLALGDNKDSSLFLSHANFAMTGFWDNKSNFRLWFFQGCFCATGATIVSGAMAERTKLRGFVTYTVFMTSIIYPVVVHWAWSGNGIFNYGDGQSIVGPSLIDFAGSGVVHLVGGIGALTGAIFVGPRKGRWDPATENEFEGHSIPFCVLGTFFLWFGWYGFNPGSTGSLHDAATAHVAAMAAVNTTLSPCAAGLAVFALRRFLPPRLLDVGGFCNGILGGLVSITAGCASVKHWEAIIIGMFGGLIYEGASRLIKKLKVDDVVDAFAVHGACGIWGVLALGFLGDPEVGGNGMFYQGNQLGSQLLAILIIIGWAGDISGCAFALLHWADFLRLSDAFQDAGADAMEHSPRKAYSHGGAAPRKQEPAQQDLAQQQEPAQQKPAPQEAPLKRPLPPDWPDMDPATRVTETRL